ncbi:hypothetical protein FGO68_gene4300 [Halteria grandinella]|uniref:Septin-type G domain-containing protein n=1 Tax=Halteria grandinella TaxID=5974 RepID=A0A8J8P0P1_HALGN|nr:hypothetical protein FGO68_gene4300 [Halteria grandinella]
MVDSVNISPIPCNNLGKQINSEKVPNIEGASENGNQKTPSQDQNRGRENNKEDPDLSQSRYDQSVHSVIHQVASILKNNKNLNIMVCGAAGIGKTQFSKAEEQIRKMEMGMAQSVHESYSFKRYTKDFEEYTLEGCEDPADPNMSNKVTLKFIDTIGHGDSLDLETWQRPIIEYITSKLDDYQKEEIKVNEKTKDYQLRIQRQKEIPDQRVHLMLYFMGSGHHTNVADFTILQRFQRFVSILPIVACADKFDKQELYKFKLDIINTAIDRKVIFLDCQKAIDVVAGANHSQASELKEKLLRLSHYPNDSVHECPPFAILNPNHDFFEKQDDGTFKQRFGRKYDWGFCDAFDDEVSDFNRLYRLIINILWNQLIELTHMRMMDLFNEKNQRAKVKEDSQNTIVRGILFGTGVMAAAVGTLFLAKLKNQ